MNQPTPEDLARDLQADLDNFNRRDGLDWGMWVCENAEAGWPAAIRRALAAEAELASLKQTIAARTHEVAKALDLYRQPYKVTYTQDAV